MKNFRYIHISFLIGPLGFLNKGNSSVLLIFPFVKVPAPEFVQNAPVTVRNWADAAVRERQESSELVYENLP